MRVLLSIALFLSTAITAAAGQTKHDRCDAYAHEAMAGTPTSTGPGRGMMRGAAVGAIGGAIGGNAGAGAAAGAGAGLIVGAARRANQKARSYQYYYDSCMSR